MKTILITGIGGNVGQGILRNIRSLKKQYRLIGTNVTPVSGGNYLCDRMHVVLYAAEPMYVSQMVSLCQKEHVDLIIPSTDHESVVLSQKSVEATLPLVAVSPEETTKLFFDKYMTWEHCHRYHIPFAKSCLPSSYHGQFGDTVVKPREGRGSRDITLSASDPHAFPDTMVVQKRSIGTEITTAFYVTKEGKLHSQMTFIRELHAGTTTLCEVTHAYDEAITTIILQLMQTCTIRGSCNIQSIVINRSSVVPFEVNGRISGTNSIRSQFGFTDVLWTIEEYVEGKKPTKARLKMGSAVRILLDIVYPNTTLKNIRDRRTKSYMF